MDLNTNKGWQAWQNQQPNESPSMLRQIWEASSSYKNDYQPDVEKGLDSLRLQMRDQSSPKIRRISPVNYALRIAAGAAVLLLAGLFVKNRLGADSDKIAANTEVGATQELALSDGSQVTLNQSSQLIYNQELGSKTREVDLTGEAFFKISRDENRPFVIETQVAKVKVLGTSFNVRSYPDDNIFEVYVETGKVKVDLKQNGKSVELTPGQFIRFNNATAETVQGTDKSAVPNAWRTGVISFKGQQLTSIFEGMSRLYGVRFALKTAQTPDCLQTLTVRKGQLEEAIKVLKTSCPNLKFQEKDGDYLVSGACCN